MQNFTVRFHPAQQKSVPPRSFPVRPSRRRRGHLQLPHRAPLRGGRPGRAGPGALRGGPDLRQRGLGAGAQLWGKKGMLGETMGKKGEKKVESIFFIFFPLDFCGCLLCIHVFFGWNLSILLMFFSVFTFEKLRIWSRGVLDLNGFCFFFPTCQVRVVRFYVSWDVFLLFWWVFNIIWLVLGWISKWYWATHSELTQHQQRVQQQEIGMLTIKSDWFQMINTQIYLDDDPQTWPVSIGNWPMFFFVMFEPWLYFLWSSSSKNRLKPKLSITELGLWPPTIVIWHKKNMGFIGILSNVGM